MKTVCLPPKSGKPPSESTQDIKDELRIFYDLYYREIQVDELNYVHMNTVLDYLAVDTVTMYENNIKQHFIEYIERYVNVVWRKKEMIFFINKIFKTTKARNCAKYKLNTQLRHIKEDIILRRQIKKSSSIYHSWIDSKINSILPQRNFKKDSLYYDLACSPQDYFKYMIYMMKEIELCGKSINNVCPLRSSVIPKYIRIDTTTLVHILFSKKQGLKGEYTSKGNLLKRRDEIWGFFLELKKNVFIYMISTNIILVI